MSRDFWLGLSQGWCWLTTWPLCWLLFWAGHFTCLVARRLPDRGERVHRVFYAVYHRCMIWSCDLQDRFDVPHGPWRKA